MTLVGPEVFSLVLFQSTPVTVWSVLDRYGLPTAMLIAMGWVIYKLLWPVLLKQIEESRSILLQQLTESQERWDTREDREREREKEFLKALERRDGIMQDGFARIHERMDRWAAPPREARGD